MLLVCFLTDPATSDKTFTSVIKEVTEVMFPYTMGDVFQLKLYNSVPKRLSFFFFRKDIS